MKRPTALTAASLLPLLFPLLLAAQDEPALPVVPADDPAALANHEGQRVTVTGFVEETRVNVTGIHFLSFKDSGFNCVTFAQQVGGFTDGPPSEVYREQWVAVSGTLEKYRGKPQIKLTTPSQIKITEAPPQPEPEPEPVVAMDETAAGAEVDPAQAAAPDKPATSSDVELVDGKPPVDWRIYFPIAGE